MAVESPPWALQSGSYNAEQTRRAVFMWAARTAANSPGIVAGGIGSASDCQLTAPASGMSVNVGTGEILIPGNEGGAQGPGYGRVSSQTNLTIAAANATNPRIDLVAATMSDSQYTEPTGGSGSQWAPQVLTGTPTAGATLSNLSGAPSLPGSSLLLGYVLVPASASNIVSGDILNVATVVQLQNPRRVTYLEPGVASNYSTTSSTYAAVDGTNLSATVRCSGAPVRVTFSGSGLQVTSSQNLVIANAMDASVSGSGAAIIGGTVTWTPFCAVTVFAPSAGLHTFAPYFAVTGGTGSIARSNVALATNQLPTLVIEELGPSF